VSEVYPETPAAAPELAAAMAETSQVRAGYARLCGEFSDHAQSGQSARIPLTVLNRHRVTAGLAALRPAPRGEKRDPYMELAASRDRNAAIAVQLDQYRNERDEAREQLAKALAANERWAATLAAVQRQYAILKAGLQRIALGAGIASQAQASVIADKALTEASAARAGLEPQS
jgi:hypothetical protein